MATNSDNKHRRGAAIGDTQAKRTGGDWQRRSERTGEFIERKSDPGPFKGVAKDPESRNRSTISATEAKNRFGALLDMAHKEPIKVQKNGRTVGVMISPEQYEKFIEASAGAKVRPVVDELLERSIQRRRSLYEALAK